MYNAFMNIYMYTHWSIGKYGLQPLSLPLSRKNDGCSVLQVTTRGLLWSHS